MGHPGAHVGNCHFFKGRKTRRIPEMSGNEGQVSKQISAIRGHGILGGGVQRLLGGQPCRQRVAGGRRDMRYASQRRIARSKTPAKNDKRSVPCVGLN